MKHDIALILGIFVSLVFTGVVAIFLAHFVSVYTAAVIGGSIAWLTGYGFGKASKYRGEQ